MKITSLFWFESTETLLKAEGYSQFSSPVKRLSDEAMPSSGFKKWVVTILSTTQVSQNVILLALLFIYRLKTLNPTVKGRSGSEYRLLTVALMLGNKCEYLRGNVFVKFANDLQSLTTTLTRTKRGPKSPAYLSQKSMSWRSNS